MDTSSCGFQMSAREIDLLATPEEEFNSRNSISSLLSSAPAPPDPAASLQQSFFDALASYLDHNTPRSHPPPLNSDNWKCFQRNFNQMADSHVPAETVGPQVQISAQHTGANSMDASNMGRTIAGVIGNAGTLQQKAYASASASLPSATNFDSISATTAEHLESQGARARPGTDPGIAKVGKKRSRASRRAPTTVLTTDTSNFRAMVQEFTGIPTAPFAASPFPRSRVDFLGVPRSNLPGATPPFLLRPFPQRTTTTTAPATNFGFPPPPHQANPTPTFLLQSLLQAQQQQQHSPPKDSIPFPAAAANFSNKTSGGLLEELGLSVVLPDLVPSDRRPHESSSACKNMMSNYNAMKVGGGGVCDRRSSSSSFNMEESADRIPPRPDRTLVDSWINPSSDAQA